MGAQSSKQMAFGAQTAAIVASLLIVAGVFVALSGNTEPSTAASTQAAATSLASWAHPLPGIVHGWNTTVGTESRRLEAAKVFGVKVQGVVAEECDDPFHWEILVDDRYYYPEAESLQHAH